MKAAIDPVTLATPFFIATVILEIVLARFGALKAHYETKDTAISLTMGLVSSVAGLLTAGASFAAAVWIYQHRLFDIPMTAVWAWVAVFLLEDLTYYWFHRLSHERRFWWAAHVNHHSSQHYNLSTALRQTWTGGIAGTWAPTESVNNRGKPDSQLTDSADLKAEAASTSTAPPRGPCAHRLVEPARIPTLGGIITSGPEFFAIHSILTRQPRGEPLRICRETPLQRRRSLTAHCQCIYFFRALKSPHSAADT